MQRAVRRRGRKTGGALRGSRRSGRRLRPVDTGIARFARDERRLLDRILATPHLGHVVRHLQPELLHRVIRTCGLEDCGELVALATPDQLQRVFDLDLWRPGHPGLDEQLDPDRFGVWLDVLMECGAAIAAEKLAGVDADLVIAALAQHVRVFDRAAVSPVHVDGAEEAQDHRRGTRLNCEIGPYLVEAKRTNAWSTVVELLLFLDAEHPDFFHRMMGGCRSLSNSDPEADGFHDLLTDEEQDMFDLAVDRERRREKQGYVSPAEARAFLHSARELQLGLGTLPPPSPLARAYFRSIEWTAPSEADANVAFDPRQSPSPPVHKEASDAIASVVELLLDAGVLTKRPLGLLEAPSEDAPALSLIETHMQFVRERNDTAYSMRTAELAYLANVIAAGCSIQSRSFTPREASDAAAAVCNLGLENWPDEWLPKTAGQVPPGMASGTSVCEDFLVYHDLIGVFQVGWIVLYRDVCMGSAETLIRILADVQVDDREIQAALDGLRFEMARQWRAGTPWRARDVLEVILFLDQPAWAALLGAIDECPVMHAAIGASRGSSVAISASDFEFISENRQIAVVRRFMEQLPAVLRG